MARDLVGPTNGADMLNGETSEALVTKWLKGLACKRPLFHSEADFQHALAWHIHTETLPECRVRLEFKPLHDRNLYLDIWLPDAGIAIELKYKTRRLDLTIGGEAFQLRDQSAHDCGRYDFLQDVNRLEALDAVPLSESPLHCVPSDGLLRDRIVSHTTIGPPSAAK